MLSSDSDTPLFSIFSIHAICLPSWSISLSGCCRGPDRHGGMAKWRSAWQHGDVEIGVAARLRWRLAKWVWVGSNRVFLSGYCGLCLGLWRSAWAWLLFSFWVWWWHGGWFLVAVVVVFGWFFRSGFVGGGGGGFL